VNLTLRRMAQAKSGRIAAVFPRPEHQTPGDLKESIEGTYRWVNLHSEEVFIPSLRVHDSVIGRILFLEENLEGAGNAFDTEQIVSVPTEVQ